MKFQKSLIACAATLMVSMPVAVLAADTTPQATHAAAVQSKMDQFIETLQLNATQKDLWEKHGESMRSKQEGWQKARDIQQKYSQIKPTNPVEGMENRIKMTEEMQALRAEKLIQMKTALKTIEAFYKSLDADQKAKVDQHYQEKEAKKHEKMVHKMKGHGDKGDKAMGY